MEDWGIIHYSHRQKHRPFIHRKCRPALRSSGAGNPESGKAPSEDDVELRVASMLEVRANYMLPFIFGVTGSLVYVLLNHYTKLRTSTLSPSDYSVMWLRLILGLVIAACVSLLIGTYAGPGMAAPNAATGFIPADRLVPSLGSSASGLAFLAGFGAEAVFTMLQNLVERVFVAQR